MKIEKKDLEKSQVELMVTISEKELEPYLPMAANELSKDMKIEGFRSGKVPYEVLKNKIGELPIMEAAARMVINKKMDELINKHAGGLVVGQPQVDITKLAPGNNLEFKVVLDILPTVDLGDYKELGIKIKETKVSDQEVQKVIEQLREAQVKEVLVEREIKDKDKVIVDIKMFLEKVPVDGGQSQGTAIIIGKDYIIPGFDKELLGAKKGEVKKFSLIYPENHYQTNLAGKKVEFEVAIKDVFERQLPELTDEFVKNFGLKTIAEMKENIKKSLEQEKIDKEKQRAELAMLDKMIAQSKIAEIPESLIANETDLMFKELEYHLSRQGASLENYLVSIKKTKEQLAEEMKEEAIKRVKSSLLIREISILEKIQAKEDEIEAEVNKMLAYYKEDKNVQEKIKAQAYRRHLETQIIHRKTLEKLREWNINK